MRHSTHQDPGQSRLRVRPDEEPASGAPERRREAPDPGTRRALLCGAALAACYALAVLLTVNLFHGNLSLAWFAQSVLRRAEDLVDLFTGNRLQSGIHFWLCQFAAPAAAGMALGASGACFQALFRNPMASPTMLGVEAGGTLGSAVYLTFFYTPMLSGLLHGSYEGYAFEYHAMSLLQKYGQYLFVFGGCVAVTLAVLLLVKLAGRGRIRTVPLMIGGALFSGSASTVQNVLLYYESIAGGNSMVVTELQAMQAGAFRYISDPVTLGFEVRVWYAALFALAAVTLFLLRQYRTAAPEGGTASPGFGRRFALSAGVGLAGLLLALLCWTLVVRPLHPPTLDVKLLTKYMRYDILEMVGIARQYPVPDGERTAPEPDRTLPGGAPEESPDAPPEQQSDGGVLPPEAGPDPSETSDLGSVTYERNRTGWLAGALLLTVLVFALLPVLVRTLRKRRLAKLVRGEPREQVVALYRFYLTRFARIGYGRAPSETEREYAERCGEPLAPFLKGGWDLGRMTERYLDARYGNLPAAQADAQALAELYPIFLRNYRELAGRWRYWTKSFVL